MGYELKKADDLCFCILFPLLIYVQWFIKLVWCGQLMRCVFFVAWFSGSDVQLMSVVFCDCVADCADYLSLVACE